MLQVEATRRQGSFQLDIAFTAEEKSVTALFGRSGAGKSTIIEMIAGLRRPEAGRIAIDDIALFDSARGIDLPPHRRRVGVVFQDGRLFPHIDVGSNLTYGMNRIPAAERLLTVPRVVELLGLGALLKRRPAKLSGGERQRVAIGRALLMSPRILLMDEPLASLDGARKAELLPFIARLPRELGIPILYVSHAADEVLHLAERMVLIEAGKVLAAGAVENIMNRPDFQSIAARSSGAQPFSVIAATVTAHDAHASRLAFIGGELMVPRLDMKTGRRVFLSIAANEVILALAQPTGLSVRNILPARITEITEASNGLMEVLLDLGCPLRARITEAACRELALTPGLEIFALIKSAALLQGEFAVEG